MDARGATVRVLGVDGFGAVDQPPAPCGSSRVSERLLPMQKVSLPF